MNTALIVSVYRLVFFPSKQFLWGHLHSTVYESNPYTIQELKDNISHAVAAIKITVLQRVNLNEIRRAQLCIDARGNHFSTSSMIVISFQHFATVLISVFTLCHGPGLPLRRPHCKENLVYFTLYV